MVYTCVYTTGTIPSDGMGCPALTHSHNHSDMLQWGKVELPQSILMQLTSGAKSSLSSHDLPPHHTIQC